MHATASPFTHIEGKAIPIAPKSVIVPMNSSAKHGLVHRQLTGKPSEEVVLAVSEVSDVDPLDFEQCLNDVIDPDALDNLTDWHDGTAVGLSFTFESYTITIEGDQLVVEDRAAGD